MNCSRLVRYILLATAIFFIGGQTAWAGKNAYISVVLNCPEHKGNKYKSAYRKYMFGAIDRDTLALTQTDGPGKFRQLTGYINGAAVIIKGKGRSKGKEWPLYFEKESSGNILDDLKVRIEGREGKERRKCYLQLQESLSQATASILQLRNEKLKNEIMKLKQEVSNSAGGANDDQRDKLIQDFKNKIIEANNAISALKADLLKADEAKVTVTLLQSKIDIKNSEIEALQNRLNDLGNLQNSNIELKSRIAGLEAQLVNNQQAKVLVSNSAPTSQTTTSAVTVATSPTSTSASITATSQTKWKQARNADEAQRFADEIQASIVMFQTISEVIENQPVSSKDRLLTVLGTEIARLQEEKSLLEDNLSSRFSTPIRPNNANLSVSAFRASDTFPKIPFYVPGTNEIGEMLVVPRVTDDGFLNYQFDFLDPTSTYDKVRDTIDVAHDDINALITGLLKVDEWTKVAQENNVNRRIEKTASCIPDGVCAEKKQGVSSIEVLFQVYEDGSTAGRIQRNKGKFVVGYNMSVESSTLLSAYLVYMRDVGAKEFNIGVMTDDEVKDLFN